MSTARHVPETVGPHRRRRPPDAAGRSGRRRLLRGRLPAPARRRRLQPRAVAGLPRLARAGPGDHRPGRPGQRARHRRAQPTASSAPSTTWRPGRPVGCSPRRWTRPGRTAASGEQHRRWSPASSARSSSGTTAMGQLERGLNRLYGVEQDRPTFAEVRPRPSVLALTAGILARRGLPLPSASAGRRPGVRATASPPTRSGAGSAGRWPSSPPSPPWPCSSAGAPAAASRAGRGWRSASSVVGRCSASWSRWRIGACCSGSAARSATPTGRWPASWPCLFWALLSAIAIFFGGRGGGTARGGAGRARRRRTRPQDRRAPHRRPPPPAGAGRRERRRRHPGEPRTITPLPRAASRASSASPPPRATAIEVLRNGDEIFPAMLEAIDAATTHDRLPHLRLLGGRDRRTSFATRSPTRPQAGVRVRVLLDGLGRATIDRSLLERHGRRRRRRPLVPAAAAARGRSAGQPPDPPQGADRRRARSASPAASASPTSGRATPATSTSGATPTSASRARRSTGSGPPSSTTGPRPTRSCFTDGIDRFPEPARGRRRGRASACEARPRRAGATSATCSGRCSSSRAAAHPHHHRLLRPRRRAVRPLCCDAGDRGVEVEILLPGPHADKRFVQVAGEAAYDRLLERGHRHLDLPAVDAARQGHDRRRARRATSARPTSTPARSRGTRRSTSSPSTPTSPRCSTASSTRT